MADEIQKPFNFQNGQNFDPNQVNSDFDILYNTINNINGNLIKPGSIQTDHILDNQITNAKLVNETIETIKLANMITTFNDYTTNSWYVDGYTIDLHWIKIHIIKYSHLPLDYANKIIDLLSFTDCPITAENILTTNKYVVNASFIADIDNTTNNNKIITTLQSFVDSQNGGYALQFKMNTDDMTALLSDYVAQEGTNINLIVYEVI